MRDSPAVAWSQMPAPGTPGPDEARPLRRGTGHGGREALERGENHGFGPDTLAPPAGSDAVVHGAGGHGRPGEEPFLVFAQRTSLRCRAAAGRGHCPVLSCPARCAEPVTGQGQDPRDSRDRHRASRPDDPRLDGRCAAGGLRRGPVRDRAVASATNASTSWHHMAGWKVPESTTTLQAMRGGLFRRLVAAFSMVRVIPGNHGPSGAAQPPGGRWRGVEPD